MSEKLIHPISGEIRKVNEVEFLDMFDPSVHDQILASAARYKDCEALVCFQKLDLSSSQRGQTTALVVGPSNTYKLSDIVKPEARLGDLPSRFQYPVAFVDYRTPNSHHATGS